MLIPKSVFGVSSCCGDDNSKFPFDGVKLERNEKGEALAVASDGKRLIVAKWKDKGIEQDFKDASGVNVVSVDKFTTLVPVKHWDEAGKLIPKKVKNDVLEHVALLEDQVAKTIPLETRDDEGTVRRVAPKPLTGTFPNWQQEYPKYDVLQSDPTSNKAVRIRLNSSLLFELVKTIGVAAGKSDDAIDVIIPLNDLRPMEIRSNDNEGIKVSALLYPINSASKDPFTGAINE